MAQQSFCERFHLEAPIWQHFEELTRIPRPSKHEAKARGYVQKVAGELGHPWRSDTIGNIVVSVPPTPGHSHSPTVIVQSHLDMVPAKRKGSTHNFLADAIQVDMTDGWLHARDTTLGADDGIGVAAALALAGDKEVGHGPLELLFTVDEEEGLTGAKELDPTLITGSFLLNLDTEEEGVIYIGCAGGRDAVGSVHADVPATTPMPEGMRAFVLTIDGLRGGHSGAEIHLPFGNALKIMGRLLRRLCHCSQGAHVASLSGGEKRNAIPRTASATIVIPAHDAMRLVSSLREWAREECGMLSHPEDRLQVRIVETAVPERVWIMRLTMRMLTLIENLPHGALLWHPEIEDLVETSTNLAIVTGSPTGEITIEMHHRSSRSSTLDEVTQYAEEVLRSGGADVVHENDYPEWQPNLGSPLLKEACETHRRLFSKLPDVKAIHAGLECGVLGRKKPGLDMVSFGPTILGAHTPDERVNVASVEAFYRFLGYLVGDLAVYRS